MDSQSKLILLNKGYDHELSLFSKDDLKKLDPKKIVQVLEFSELDLLLEAGDDDYFEMPEIDDYFIPNRVEMEDGEPYKYPANDNFSLFSYSSSEYQQNIPLVPGLYTIKSIIKKKEYYSYFYVVPKDLTVPDWKQMKDEVESAVSGLAVDFYRRRNAESISNEIIDDDSSFSMTKIKFLLQREKETRFVIEKMRKEARYKIGKKYTWEPLGAKNLTDSQTIRKMGERPDKRGMVFSAKRYLEYDVPENRWAKMIIEDLITFTSKSIKKLNAIKMRLIEDRATETRYDRRRKKGDVYFQESRLQTSLETIDDDLIRLEQLISYFRNVLNDEFLRATLDNVNRSVPKALILNPNYNFLYKMYTILNKKQTDIILDESYEYSWKRTDKLYEIWTYIKTIEALIANGYEPKEGWIFSKNPFQETLPSLNSGDFVVFENSNGNIIRLVFDSVMKKIKKSTVENPLMTDSSRKKPDIRLDIFNSDLEYAGSILFDAKYKRLGNVLKPGKTEKGNIEQFREYKKTPYVTKDFWHVDELLQSQLMPVQAVIVMYPNDDGFEIGNQIVDQSIFINELNPHEGMNEFISLIGKQLSDRYEIFNKYYKE